MVDRSRSTNTWVKGDQKGRNKNGAVQIFSEIRKEGQTQIKDFTDAKKEKLARRKILVKI